MTKAATIAELRAEAGVEAPPEETFDESGPHGGGGPFYWYCLDQAHGGEPFVSATRVFSTDSADGCPSCPVCLDAVGRQRQVSAFPMVDAVTLPEKIQELARNSGLAEIVLKEG